MGRHDDIGKEIQSLVQSAEFQAVDNGLKIHFGLEDRKPIHYGACGVVQRGFIGINPKSFHFLPQLRMSV